MLALAVGGAIGLEREFRTGIGLRTLTLVCLGATLFTVYGEQFPLADGDPRRITSSVVAAVGFLGAGTILTHRSGIFGFTTAASVWLVAALGQALGRTTAHDSAQLALLENPIVREFRAVLFDELD